MPRAARNQPPATPRYIAIAALVRDRIATDQLGPHTLLPSERELADQHGVSRMTARQALSLLESEGVVYRKPPRGTFVAERETSVDEVNELFKSKADTGDLAGVLQYTTDPIVSSDIVTNPFSSIVDGGLT